MPKNGNQEIPEQTRRALLTSTALGASSLIAGCNLGGDTPTDTPTDMSTSTATDIPTTAEGDLAHVNDQTLTWYTMQDLENMTWFGTMPAPGPTGEYAPIDRMAYGLTMQPEIRVGNQGEPKLESYEDVEIKPKEITVTIRDDAKWSNGDHVTSSDAIAATIGERMIHNIGSFESVREAYEDTPSTVNFLESVFDYEIVDDKTFKFINPDGFFGHLDKDSVYTNITVNEYWGGARQNTNVEPYGKWWNAIEDYWKQVKNGEIDPWGGEFSIDDALSEVLFGPHGWSKDDEESSYEQHWEEHFRKPGNVHTTGAWTLKNINGDKNIILEPNEHHRHHDKVNFDEIKIVARKSHRSSLAAMKANSQDYYRGTIPQHVIDSLSDNIEQRLQPNNGGLAFAFDNGSDLFGDRKVRQAVMHAIDTDRLAKSVHKKIFDPVTTPGAHPWNATEILGDEWISNNLMTYEQRDSEKANELMNEAGYHQEGGQWLDENGDEVSVTIPTPDGTPEIEPTLGSQLSEFGINASLQTYSGSVFNEKKGNGEFDIWPTNRGVGFAHKAIGRLYVFLVIVEFWARDMFRVFPEEQVDETTYSDGWPVISPANLENFGNYSMEAPPVGKPDGELKTWNPPKLGWFARSTNDQEKYKTAMRKLAWLFNWQMPVLPVANGQTQNLLDTAHWNWPSADSNAWKTVGNEPENLLANGRFVQANPENPEEGAIVEE